MKIAILGTRGIPNHYGGFEQFAQYLAKGLTEKGYDVTVYNSHTHPYKEKTWNGVRIIHCKDLENKIGTAGQFIYDLNCILHSRKQQYDVILQLGYTSNSLWGWLLPKNAVVTTNMDGLEWKRTKYSSVVRKFLKHAEKLAVRYSDYLIADSMGIQEYLNTKYNKTPVFIPYGADLFVNNNSSILDEFDASPYNYDMLIARLEPENSIEIILDGKVKSNSERKFLIVGKHLTPYGEYLKKKYSLFPQIQFIGGIYNIDKLNNLRYYSNIYFHGHTVGGTNPSLLEAMASKSLICANDNPFNKYILEKDALYFKTSDDVASHFKTIKYDLPIYQQMIENNKKKIEEKYTWNNIIDQYADHLKEILNRAKTNRVTGIRTFPQKPITESITNL